MNQKNNMDKPFFKIEPYGRLYLISDPEGNHLYGDRLADTEEDAIQACRIANMAFERGKKELIKQISKL